MQVFCEATFYASGCMFFILPPLVDVIFQALALWFTNDGYFFLPACISFHNVLTHYDARK
ncbi:MAG: hypothetical protein WCT20_04265 [Candidatus Babeliales bacterium]